jgi:hypothetical protein
MAYSTDERHGKLVMALAFCFALLLYYGIALRAPSMRGAALSRVLWGFYLALGLAGSVIFIADGIPTVYPPNYLSTLYLTACILLCVWAFGNVRDTEVAHIRPAQSIVRPIENILIACQLFSILYFLPFALAALQEIRAPFESTWPKPWSVWQRTALSIHSPATRVICSPLHLPWRFCV